jgi:hypothetical protein
MIVLWVPLPRYLFDKCYTDPLLMSNKAEDGFEWTMRNVLEDMATWMGSMAEMRRLKNVLIYNPLEPIELLDDERILQLWGTDPVHPTDVAYKAIASHLSDTIESLAAETRLKTAAAAEAVSKPPPFPSPRAPKPVRRESWISGTEPVAKR